MPTLQIDVIFGLDQVKPAIKGSLPTTVSPDPTTSHSGGPVIWSFLSFDKKIAKAEVVFTDPEDTYFPPQHGGAPTNHCQAGFSGGTTASMWGRTPHLPHKGWRASKYTIKAYDAAGHALMDYELDPTVVTVDP